MERPSSDCPPDFPRTFNDQPPPVSLSAMGDVAIRTLAWDPDCLRQREIAKMHTATPEILRSVELFDWYKPAQSPQFSGLSSACPTPCQFAVTRWTSAETIDPRRCKDRPGGWNCQDLNFREPLTCS